MYNALRARDDLGRLRRPQSLKAYNVLFKNCAKLRRKAEQRTTWKRHTAHIQFYTVKAEQNTQQREGHDAEIPCFPVYVIKVFIFTMFYRVKCALQEFAKTLGFYRVNRTSGPRMDPKMEPEMGLESLKTRVLPRFYAIGVHNTPCFTV